MLAGIQFFLSCLSISQDRLKYGENSHFARELHNEHISRQNISFIDVWPLKLFQRTFTELVSKELVRKFNYAEKCDPIKRKDRTVVEWWDDGIPYDAECLVVWNKSLSKMELQWNAVGFSVLHVRKVFCNAPCSVIIHHLFLFNAIKIVLYQ